MKLGMVLSLAANLTLVVGLGVQARNENKKTLAAVAETQDADVFTCGRIAKTVVKIGYVNGCMTAISQSRHMQPGDPLAPLFAEFCMQGGDEMAEKLEMRK